MCGRTSFLGAQPSVPSDFLGEKVLGEEVSRFFSVQTKVCTPKNVPSRYEMLLPYVDSY